MKHRFEELLTGAKLWRNAGELAYDMAVNVMPEEDHQVTFIRPCHSESGEEYAVIINKKGRIETVHVGILSTFSLQGINMSIKTTKKIIEALEAVIGMYCVEEGIDYEEKIDYFNENIHRGVTLSKVERENPFL